MNPRIFVDMVRLPEISWRNLDETIPINHIGLLVLVLSVGSRDATSLSGLAVF